MTNPVLEALMSRRSCRNYKPDPVPRADLEAILEAASYSPTGHGRQPWRFIVIEDRNKIEELAVLNRQHFGRPSEVDPFFGAPCVILVAADMDTAFSPVEDDALALGSMMLAAHSLGLASCWVNRAYETLETKEGKDLLASWGVSENLRGIGHLTLGYASKPLPEAKERKQGIITFLDEPKA